MNDNSTLYSKFDGKKFGNSHEMYFVLFKYIMENEKKFQIVFDETNKTTYEKENTRILCIFDFDDDSCCISMNIREKIRKIEICLTDYVSKNKKK